MKRCPQCGREYDVTMMFCLDDGAELLYGPVSPVPQASACDSASEPGAIATGFPDEPATAILSDPQAKACGTGLSEPGAVATGSHSDDAATKAFIYTTSAAEPRESLSELSEKQSFSANRAAKPLLIALGIAVIVLGGVFGYRYFQSCGSGQINSIAVLPFENRSRSGDTEYLSDGLADSLIYRLSQLPNLKVSPTSSVMRYKGMAGDTAKVANELGVDAVMTGRLSQVGDSLNISVQLIDVQAGKVLWAEQYDRKMADLLATQREMATTITQKLELKLAGSETRGITKKYTDNNEAYQLYLKGRYYWNKRDEENLRKAIEQFKAAADKDPNFALALAGLADSYVVLPYYSTEASAEVLPQAKAFATRALEIDDSLGDAHASLGYVLFQSWEWAEAEKEFRRSIELNPNYGTAHRWFAQLLQSLGRDDEALIEYKKAVELEPLSLVAYNNLAEMYIRNGDFDRATEQFKKALDLDPNWYFARMNLANVLIRQGRNAEAVVEAEKAVDLSKRQGIPLGILGNVYARSGRQADAIKIVEELKEGYQKHQTGGLDIARVYSRHGEKNEALAWMEKELQARNQKMPIQVSIGIFDSLRDDPRFKDLLKRMGLPE